MAFVAVVPVLSSSKVSAFFGNKQTETVVAAKNATGLRMSAEKNVKAGLIAAAAAGILVVSAPVFAADGKAIFTANCAACHTGGNNVIQAEKTLKKAALEQYLDGGYNVDAIKYQVTNGKNAMPAFGGRLAEDEIESVAKYVYEQAGSDWA
eukprot:CAMPEP_0196654304 /NCGR_PEP_ID=MMETSP1086-20130531/4012_1 /TAXON_ID=77921 /ORGANISM="Cyanoptyche  gloeocystis , Strain SAG4.97" /LENGTH=150 /DNA_ID=CAMNT_0041985989 /DNA_START=80 /DNA_END=532 /DNA_ORIENTATION=-